MIGSRTFLKRGATLAAGLAIVTATQLGGPPTVTAAPARAAVSVVSLHLEQPGSTFAATGPTLGQARVGQNLRVTLYASITDAARPSAAQVQLRASVGGKAVLISNGTFAVSRSQMQGSTAGWRWFYNTVHVARPGRYTVSGSFRMNGVTF